MKEVIDEIDRRIKRLEAEIELAELSMRRMERSLKGEEVLRKAGSYSIYYLLFAVVWMVAGLLFFIGIRNRLPVAANFPVLRYGLFFILIFLAPVAYILWTNRGERATEGIESRERWARMVIRLFYTPLKEALERGDEAKLVELADSLLENRELARAIEGVNEGDSKMMAYALYLYIRRSPELKAEIVETSEKLANKPLKKLLLLGVKDL